MNRIPRVRVDFPTILRLSATVAEFRFLKKSFKSKITLHKDCIDFSEISGMVTTVVTIAFGGGGGALWMNNKVVTHP